eukprot:14915856-Alexandrium_andersonii.AAC.1
MSSAKGLTLRLGPADESSLRPTAGVGALARAGLGLVQVKPQSRCMQRAAASGRLFCGMVDCGIGAPIRIYNLYLQTASTFKRDARAANEALLQDILADARDFKGPFVIAGDLNCEPSTIPSLA